MGSENSFLHKTKRAAFGFLLFCVSGVCANPPNPSQCAKILKKYYDAHPESFLHPSKHGVRRRVAEYFKSAKSKVLQETLFLIPINDGEALRSYELLNSLSAPFVKGLQVRWGFKLEENIRDYRDFEYFILSSFQNAHKIKKVVLFELPAPRVEQLLSENGYEVVIIDHHHYVDITPTRYKELSSIEQLANFIGWKLSDADSAVAINDKSYIPGLKQLGLDEDSIREVRLFDYIAQGKDPHFVELSRQRAQELIGLIPEVDGIKVMGDWERVVDTAILKEELNLRSPSGFVNLFEVKHNRVGFTGSPAIVDALLSIDYESMGYNKNDLILYSGGSREFSAFFGFKPIRGPHAIAEEIPPHVWMKMFEVAKSALPAP